MLSGINARGFSADHIDPEKIAAINVNEPEGAPGDQDDLLVKLAQGEFMDQVTFYDERFKFIFDMGSEVTALPGMSPTGQQLTSIAIQPQEEQIARKVSDRLYGVCLRYRLLHFVLKPGGEAVLDLFIIYQFFKGKKELVEAEIRMQLSQQHPIEAERKAA